MSTKHPTIVAEKVLEVTGKAVAEATKLPQEMLSRIERVMLNVYAEGVEEGFRQGLAQSESEK